MLLNLINGFNRFNLIQPVQLVGPFYLLTWLVLSSVRSGNNCYNGTSLLLQQGSYNQVATLDELNFGVYNNSSPLVEPPFSLVNEVILGNVCNRLKPFIMCH